MLASHNYWHWALYHIEKVNATAHELIMFIYNSNALNMHFVDMKLSLSSYSPLQ